MNSRAAQVIKYGGEEGYRAEMRRRRSMVKSPTGFAIMDKEKIRAAQLKGAKTKVKQRQYEKDHLAQTEDGSQDNN